MLPPALTAATLTAAAGAATETIGASSDSFGAAATDAMGVVLAPNNLARGAAEAGAQGGGCTGAGFERGAFSFLADGGDELVLDAAEGLGDSAADSWVGTGAGGAGGASSSLELHRASASVCGEKTGVVTVAHLMARLRRFRVAAAIGKQELNIFGAPANA